MRSASFGKGGFVRFPMRRDLPPGDARFEGQAFAVAPEEEIDRGDVFDEFVPFGSPTEGVAEDVEEGLEHRQTGPQGQKSGGIRGHDEAPAAGSARVFLEGRSEFDGEEFDPR